MARFALDPETPLCVAVGDPGVRVAAEAARHRKPLVVMLTGDSTREPCPPLSLVARHLLIAGAVPVLGIRQPLSSDHPPPPEYVDSDRVATPAAQTRMSRPGPSKEPGVLLTDGPV